MNNREWLQTLTDEQFADWCTTLDYDVLTKKGFEAVQPSPKLAKIKSLSIDPTEALILWLKEERGKESIVLMDKKEAKKKKSEVTKNAGKKKETKCSDSDIQSRKTNKKNTRQSTSKRRPRSSNSK